MLRALQDEHGEALLAHSVRLTGGDHTWAEHLVRRTLLRARRQPDVLGTEPVEVRSWLFRTARDLAVDDWRRRTARTDPAAVDPPEDPPPGLDEAERAVEAWTVAEALARLLPKHREVLIECFHRGRSVAEVAAQLGLPPATVTARTHYAMHSLRMALDELGVTG
ncbi:MAG TPA: sigma-70 family RNA polymerase sigma factor [Actinoplanes sp.]|nr:sigma-70 family RNA polymerase sigma factor [Actinoplanes sp.]